MNIIPLHILNEKKCNKIIINCIENGHPVSFSKYGDGEYLCASSAIGTNCDNDTYTPKLRMALLESFKYMTENCDNAFIGRWEGNQKGSAPLRCIWLRYRLQPYRDPASEDERGRWLQTSKPDPNDRCRRSLEIYKRLRLSFSVVPFGVLIERQSLVESYCMPVLH